MVRPVFTGRCVADIFDEIGDDLRAERLQRLLRRYGPLLALVVVLIGAGVAGWQFWRGRQGQQTDQVATSFITAQREAAGSRAAEGTTPSRTQAIKDFNAVADTASEGYRTLARLEAAGLQAASGDLPTALQLWNQVANDNQADPLLRELANLLWVQHQVDGGAPDAVADRLAPLVAVGSPWRPMALEQQALLALRTGDSGRARAIFRQLQIDGSAPDGVRARASALLTRMGAAPGIQPGDALGAGE